MFIRKEYNILQQRLEEAPRFIQIITGPRQVGKTTLVEQLLKTTKIPYHYISADGVPASSGSWIGQQWESARIKLKNSSSPEVLLVIDEIQKIHNWSEAVKKEWDQDKNLGLNIHVILLGSSTLLIEKGLSESLMGRFELIKLPHWSYKEMSDAFGFTPEQYVWFGSYPGSASLISDESRWKDYMLNSIIETTISKDILSLTNIHKPSLLKNLFELSCTYSGQILSYTKILGQLSDSGNSTTLTHYQSLLDKIWFVSGLRKYSLSRVSAKSSIPKWLVYNTAFMSVYSGMKFNEAVKNPEFWGRHVESSVGAYMLNYCNVNNCKLYYWREANKEVDFVMEKDRKIISIEVKSGKYKPSSGLELFKDKYKPAKTILISSDTISWQDFLKSNLYNIFD